MKKRFLVITLFLFKLTVSYAQLSLYNTRTLYDSFENPSQSAFYADSSRKYAFNFFVPTIGINTVIKGEAQMPVKRLLFKGDSLNTQGLTLGERKINKLTIDQNTYILALKVFKTVKFHKEIGFSWQIKSDTYAEITNETLAIFDNYKRFAGTSYTDPFNNYGYSLNYHQFSFSYRENWDRRLGLGIKISYLSGIVHNKLDIDSSSLGLNKQQDSYNLSLYGKYKSNVSWDQARAKMLYPGFKNPGMAVTLSANYKLRGGWNLLSNLKDLGFIYWNKENSYTYLFNDVISISSASSPSANSRLGTQIQKLFDNGSSGDAYTTLINGKAEFLVNKDAGTYQPSLFLSKNLFYKGGDVALINRIQHRALNLSLSTAYKLNTGFQLGGQFMIKTPNKEFFLGSEQLLQSYYTTKGALTANENIGKGNTGASVYLGFALKFGPLMERQQNANNIPLDRDVKDGFFRRIFSKKRKGGL